MRPLAAACAALFVSLAAGCEPDDTRVVAFDIHPEDGPSEIVVAGPGIKAQPSERIVVAPKGGTAAPPPRLEAPPSPPCGEVAGRPCPLQGFMRGVATRAMANEDFAVLERVFRRVETFAPPGFDGWVGFTTYGIAAAQEKRITDVRIACDGCHAAHLARYRASGLRGRAIR